MLVDLLDVTASARSRRTSCASRFTGPGLAGMDTWPDQQLKLCSRGPAARPRLPEADPADVMSWYQAFLAIPEDERPWLRSYTVRRLQGERIDVDFVLHGDDGPARRGRATARPGDVLGRYGPDEAYRRPLRRGGLVPVRGRPDGGARDGDPARVVDHGERGRWCGWRPRSNRCPATRTD